MNLKISFPLVTAIALTIANGCDSSGDDPDVTASPRPDPRDPPPPDLPKFPTDTIVPSEPVGYLPGEGSVSPTGSAAYSIPLNVPPGRAGIQPSLALAYNSRGSNGLLGVGWALSGLSEIRRCASTIASNGRTDAVNWLFNDNFCIDGQKLSGYEQTIDGINYHTESDTFARITSHTQNWLDGPETFEMRSKEGQILTFSPIDGVRTDYDNNPLVLGPPAYTQLHALWVLTEVRDRSGNSLTIEYAKAIEPDGRHALEYRPTLITYTHGPADAALRVVELVYEDRLGYDVARWYDSGVAFKATQRLKSINMSAPAAPKALPSVAWHYDLEYTISDSSFRSLLASVRLRDAAGTSLWAKQFDWSSSTDGIDLTSIPIQNQMIQSDVNHADGAETWCRRPPPDPSGLVFDADGDGKDDFLYWDDYECVTPNNLPEGIAGKVVYHLKLRVSSTGPLAQVYDVGEAHQFVCEAPASCKFDYIGFSLSGSRAIDVDGGGRQVLYARHEEGGLHQYARFGWNATTHQLDQLDAWESKERAEVIDLDGDGLVDLVESDGSAWVARMNLGPPSFAFGPPKATGAGDALFSIQCNGARVGDFNGDGRGDVLVPGTTQCSPGSIISIDDNGWITTTPTDLASSMIHAIADLDGDGLSELLSSDGSSNGTVRWNTGRGYLDAEAVAGAPTPTKSVRTLDANGDGRQDLYASYPNGSNPSVHDEYIYVSLANATSGSQFFQLLVKANVPSSEPNSNNFAIEQGDFDGDGKTEILELEPGGGTGFPHQHDRQLVMRTLAIPTDFDLLVGVRDEGASHPRETFAYSRAWSDAPSPATCAYPQRCMRTGLTVVREHGVSAGEALVGHDKVTQYSYDDPRSDLRGMGFLGFARVREWIPGLFRERVTEYDNAARKVQSGREFYPYASVAKRVVETVPLVEQPVALPSANVPANVRAHVTDTSYVNEYAWTSVASVMTRISRWNSIEGEGPVTLTATTATVGALDEVRLRHGSYGYDPYGNIKLTISTTIGGDTQTNGVTYLNNDADWLIGLPIRTEVAAYPSGSQAVEPRVHGYEYDNLGRPIRVTREPDYPASDLWQQTQVDRDARGLVWRDIVSAVNEPNRVTRYYRDDEGVFVQQLGNAAGHFQTTLYHPTYGTPVVTMDANGVLGFLKYDGFGRLRYNAPGGVAKTLGSFAAYQPSPGINAGVVVSASSTDGSETSTTTDELGRTVLQSAKGFDGNWSVTAMTYNLFGSRTTITRPGANKPGSAAAITTYDGLGQVTRTQAFDGVTTVIAHGMFKTKTTNPDGRVGIVERDLENRIVTSKSFLDLAALQAVATNYTYGKFGGAEQITDSNGNITFVQYDKLGRRTHLNDPDRGMSVTYYNGFDEPTTEVDAALSQTKFYHDAIGRLQTVIDSEGTRTFTWDTSQNGVGKLAQSESPDGVVVVNGYDKLGRANKTTLIVDSNTPNQMSFVTEAAYDTFGRLDALLYPDVPGRPRFTVKLHYAGGYLTEREDISDPAKPRSLWRVDAREIDGMLAKATLGNSVQTAWKHDPSTGRLQHVESHPTASPTLLQSLDYAYTANGEVQTRTDSVGQRVESYSYDGLDRLAGWKLSSLGNAFPARDTKFTYDAIGNLVDVKTNGNLIDHATYGGNGKPHALATFDGASFIHDIRGRQIDGPKRSIIYKPFDLPAQITTKGAAPLTVSFAYDATHGRVKKWTVQGSTIYAGSYERRAKPGSIKHVFYVPGENGAAAQITYDEVAKTEQRNYLLTDALGSVDVVVDENGGVERRFSEPYGKRIGVDGLPAAPTTSDVTYGFTGQEEESDIDLVNMGGRLYDPSQRRFITPDPIVSNPYFGQTLNHYAYVRNNPLRFTDPSGYEDNICHENDGESVSEHQEDDKIQSVKTSYELQVCKANPPKPGEDKPTPESPTKVPDPWTHPAPPSPPSPNDGAVFEPSQPDHGTHEGTIEGGWVKEQPSGTSGMRGLTGVWYPPGTTATWTVTDAPPQTSGQVMVALRLPISFADVPEGKTGASTTTGVRAISGFSNGGVLRAVMANTAIMGYPLRGAGALDWGYWGLFYASHAERAVALQAPGLPIWVNRVMCSDCQGWMQCFAVSNQVRQIVVDPLFTRVFYPNGRVETSETIPVPTEVEAVVPLEIEAATPWMGAGD